MLRPFHKKEHTKLNRPHREEAFDVLTILSAITARLRNLAGIRCHRKCAPGVISSPGGSGLRVFSPPGDYARSQSRVGALLPG